MKTSKTEKPLTSASESRNAFSRRNLLRLAAAAGVGTLAAQAEALPLEADQAATGVLVDTTLCVGCRGCEAACAESHHLPGPERPGDERIFDSARSTGTEVFTVVNRASVAGPDGESRYAKTQCFHCVSPGCASACPVRALEKTPEGPVIYHRGRCMGCRYCMISCPFGVPKYEYDKAVPYVRKCDFCAERQADGLAPACASVCPTGALEFGRREALLDKARERVWGNPGRYEHTVFGEHEAGGTSWIYIGDVPQAKLGLKTDVEHVAYSELTGGALSAVPAIITLWPPLLMGLYTATRKRTPSPTEPDAGDDEIEKGGAR